MKFLFDYGKKIYLEPYTTFQEKEVLLQNMLAGEDISLRHTLDIFRDNILISDEEYEALTVSEIKIILFKLRSLSVGEVIDTNISCDCGYIIPTRIMLDEVYAKCEDPEIDIKDQFKELNYDNFHEFVDLDVDELDLDEYDDLFEKVKNSVTNFNFIKEVTCKKCDNIINTKIDDTKYIAESLSEDSIMSLYQVYNQMIFYANYSKQDIDTLIPFERSILLKLLENIKTELT